MDWNTQTHTGITALPSLRRQWAGGFLPPGLAGRMTSGGQGCLVPHRTGKRSPSFRWPFPWVRSDRAGSSLSTSQFPVSSTQDDAMSVSAGLKSRTPERRRPGAPPDGYFRRSRKAPARNLSGAAAPEDGRAPAPRSPSPEQLIQPALGACDGRTPALNPAQRRRAQT